jgi:hypothetical protein
MQSLNKQTGKTKKDAAVLRRRNELALAINIETAKLSEKSKHRLEKRLNSAELLSIFRSGLDNAEPADQIATRIIDCEEADRACVTVRGDESIIPTNSRPERDDMTCTSE